MPISTLHGILFLALDAFVAGVCWSAGCWLTGKVLK